jgi:hypothetical protein
MTVNITVIFQVFHFFIAYMILEKLFFRYAIAVLKKRDSHVVHLRQSIIEQRLNVDTLRIYVKEQWQRYHRMLMHEVPSLRSPRLMVSSESIYAFPQIPASKQEIDKLCQQLTSTLIDKVTQ